MPNIKSSRLCKSTLLASLFLLVWSCGGSKTDGDPEAHQREDAGVDSRDTRTVNNRCPGSVPDEYAGGDPKSGDFEKPRAGRSSNRTYREKPPSDTSNLYRNVSLWSRAYMAEPEGANTVWLEHGAHFSLDGVATVAGSAAPSGFQLRVLAFVDFRRVPLTLQPVESSGEWTPRGEFSNLNYSEVADIQISAGEPFHFTLVLPPESLGSKGAHDIRLVFLPNYQPYPDGTIVAPRAFLGTFGYRLYYGGYETTRTVDEPYPSLERVRPDATLGDHLSWAYGRLLYPKSEKSKLSATEDSEALRLARVFTTADDTIQLEALAAGSSDSNYPGRNYYLVLDGAEPLERLSGVGRVGRIPAKPGEVSSKYANRLPVSVPVEDSSTHAIRLLSFPEPNCNWLDAGGNPPPDGRLSNIIYVRRK